MKSFVSAVLGTACVVISACASAQSGPQSTTPAGGAAGVRPVSATRGGSVAYQPIGAARYTLHRLDSVTVQLPNGSSQVSTLTRTGYLSVSSTGSTPMQVTFVLDSLSVNGPAQFSAAADSARGTRWTAAVSPTGRLTQLRADRTTIAGEQIRSMLPLLFPLIPSGGVRAGATWVDSTTDSLRADAFMVEERAIATSLARPATPHDGHQAIPVDIRATFTRSGVGTPFGQPADVRATGTRQLTSWIGIDGLFGGASGTEISDMTLNFHAVGQSLAMKQTATFSITVDRASR